MQEGLHGLWSVATDSYGSEGGTGRRLEHGLGPQSPQAFPTLHRLSPNRLTTSLVSSFSLNEDNKSIYLRGLGKLIRFHGVPRTVPHKWWLSVSSSPCADFHQPWNCGCFPGDESASCSDRLHPSYHILAHWEESHTFRVSLQQTLCKWGQETLPSFPDSPMEPISACRTWQLEASLNMKPMRCLVTSPSPRRGTRRCLSTHKVTL